MSCSCCSVGLVLFIEAFFVMDKNTFSSHLKEATKATLEATEKQCFNVFSKNVLYFIKPNNLKISKSLDEDEKQKLRERIKERNKKLTFSNVVDRLSYDKKVPAWISISVNKSTATETIIELKTSRKLTKTPIHSHGEFPPFHVSVRVPPLHKGEKKFDVNWQYQWWTINVWIWKWKRTKQKRKNRNKDRK